MEDQQRRSPRILLSIRVGVSGTDEDGRPFETSGRTVTVNRHGGCIRISHPLNSGQTICIVNEETGEQEQFRVIDPVAPPLDQLGDWGIECVNAEKNIWNIEFPPLLADSDAHVLLECRRCQALALLSLSLVEVEVLETAGLLTKTCEDCRLPAPWGYPLRTFALEGLPDQLAPRESSSDAQTMRDRRRKYRRQAQLPLRVRDYFGEIEFSRTENISHSGFCFSSLRTYRVGQGIVVICPFDGANEHPEIPARIVRAESASGSERHIYGARYVSLGS
jgi:hypothetical protein